MPGTRPRRPPGTPGTGSCPSSRGRAPVRRAAALPFPSGASDDPVRDRGRPRPDRRYRVPGAVRAGSLPASLLGAPALWPLGPEELGELLEQLRVLTGLPRPAPPATTVLLAPPPAPVPDRSQAGSGPGPAGVKFRRQLDRLVDFAATHGRLPSTGRSAPVQERRLGTWLCRQRRRHRDGTAPRKKPPCSPRHCTPAGPNRNRPPPEDRFPYEP
ncbi:helicase associated domain-containing protein [Sinomonas atrocyanea]|uniref:helicase associated domain-containing protein n=1 Tax=Sinomonas atrocyanea TaxID=37927 RepID=UPI00352B2ADD